MNPAPPLCEAIAVERDGTKRINAAVEYYCYVLRSVRDGSLYFGCTSDLRNRLAEHQSGRSRATKGHGPWELIYYEAYRCREDAYRRERSLKQFGGAYRQLRQRLRCELSKRGGAG